MTESTFPFDAPGDDAAPREGSRRKLALAGLAGALVVAAVGYFGVMPMLSSDSAAATPATHAAPKKQDQKKDGKAKPAAKAPAKPIAQPKTYNDTDSRDDPFHPLVEPPQQIAAAPDGVVAPPAGTDGGTGVVTAPGTSGSGTTAGSGTTSGGTTSGSSASVGGQRVALVHVYTKDGKQFAQTKVGDTVYSPAVGSTFATSYKLLATSGKTATYLFGDEQFTLTEGQEVLK